MRNPPKRDLRSNPVRRRPSKDTGFGYLNPRGPSGVPETAGSSYVGKSKAARGGQWVDRVVNGALRRVFLPNNKPGQTITTPSGVKVPAGTYIPPTERQTPGPTRPGEVVGTGKNIKGDKMVGGSPLKTFKARRPSTVSKYVPSGRPPVSGNYPGDAGDTGGNPGKTDPKHKLILDLLALMKALPTSVYQDPSILDQGAHPIDQGLAGKLSNQQFAGPIADLQDSIARQPRDAAQHLHDIENWYGQVLKSQGIAKTRNEAASTNAVANDKSITQGILSSIGGAANPGANTVAAAGDAATALQSQLGTNESQFQNDLTPLLQLEESGQKSAESARQTKLVQDLHAQLRDVMSQRGAAKTESLLKILEANNGINNQNLQNRLNLDQYNQGLRQQGFQNKVTLESLRQAAALNNAQVKYYGKASGSAFVPWMQLDAGARQQYISAALSNSIGNDGTLLTSLPNAWSRAKQYLVSQGFNKVGIKGTPTGRSVQGLLDSALRGAYDRTQAKILLAKQTGQ